jgi:hypothetical protein
MATTRTNPDRNFFLTMTLLALAVVIGGFAPTYYLKLWFGTPELKLSVHVHSILATAWCALLVTQTILIRKGRYDWHRILGMSGLAIAALMVITGYMVIFGKPRPTVASRAFIFTPMLGLLLFSIFVATAVYYRRNAAMHKRLMYLSLLFIVGAAMARLLRHFGDNSLMQAHLHHYAVYVLLFLPLVIYDLVRLRKLHRATVVGIAVHALMHPLHFLVAFTPTWQRFANWLTNG